MSRDFVDDLQLDWEAEGAELDKDALGNVLRIQALARVLAEQTEQTLVRHGLNWVQYDVLSCLRRQGKPFTLTVSALAQASSLSNGAMTTRIDGLVSTGYVARCRSDQDRRQVLVSLTKTGKVLVENAAKSRFEEAVSSQKALDAGERQQLASLLRQWLVAL